MEKCYVVLEDGTVGHVEEYDHVEEGELAKNFTRLETNVKMSYCPFCGEKQE